MALSARREWFGWRKRMLGFGSETNAVTPPEQLLEYQSAEGAATAPVGFGPTESSPRKVLEEVFDEGIELSRDR